KVEDNFITTGYKVYPQKRKTRQKSPQIKQQAKTIPARNKPSSRTMRQKTNKTTEQNTGQRRKSSRKGLPSRPRKSLPADFTQKQEHPHQERNPKARKPTQRHPTTQEGQKKEATSEEQHSHTSPIFHTKHPPSAASQRPQHQHLNRCIRFSKENPAKPANTKRSIRKYRNRNPAAPLNNSHSFLFPEKAHYQHPHQDPTTTPKHGGGWPQLQNSGNHLTTTTASPTKTSATAKTKAKTEPTEEDKQPETYPCTSREKKHAEPWHQDNNNRTATTQE
ncbi:hypothetical protein Ancab_008679, partial [Ancistrocladus abbreviatus]